MKADKLQMYLTLLKFAAVNKHFELRTAEARLGISYSTLYVIVSKWEKEGLLERVKKDLLLLGGDRYEYFLTKKGKAFIRKMSSLLQEALESLEED